MRIGADLFEVVLHVAGMVGASTLRLAPRGAPQSWVMLLGFADDCARPHVAVALYNATELVARLVPLTYRITVDEDLGCWRCRGAGQVCRIDGSRVVCPVCNDGGERV